jgi:poly(3-hydroxyalkanoate) depolymerase
MSTALVDATVPWAPRFRTLQLAGTPVRTAVNGGSDGPTVLLINGIGANIEMWEPLATRLPGARLVMFDFPGTGSSQPLPRRRRMSGLADLVVQLLDELDLPDVDVVGYSWGGALAQQLAYQHPQRVRSLVLAATIPGLGGQPPAPWVVAAMGTPLRYYSPAFLRLVAPVIFGTPLSADRSQDRARRRRPPSMVGYAHQMWAITGWTSRPWLSRLTVRVLVLAGEGDPLCPARNARILARCIPDARLEMLPGGHLFLLQHPDGAARAIQRFLGQPGSPSTT